MCGTCGRKRLAECTCGMAAQMRGELAGLLKEGKSRNQVYEYFMAKWGSQEPLAMPIDEGFNRLAWAVPYALGVLGAVVAGSVAVRWSRTHQEEPEAVVATRGDADAWQQKLDEELRDLD